VVRDGGGGDLVLYDVGEPIALPGGRTLEILPKVGDEDDAGARALVMRMLAVTGQVPDVEEDELAAYAASPHLIEAYLRLAVDLALAQLGRGLVHAYQRLDLRLPAVRGRLRIGAQLARLPERVDVHLLTADQFTADTPVNRALKAGIARVERLSRVTETRARCRELLARLGAVSEPPANRRRAGAMLDGLAVDRRHRHLKPLLSLLRLILQDRGSAAAAGNAAQGPAWLFDMPKLFEALIAKRLARLGPVSV
jgi:5-methylcytosine-specific restriction enzyme subunit McrC